MIVALSSPAVEAQIGGGEVEPTEWPPAQFGQWSGPWDFKDEMTRETPESPLYLPFVTEITHAGVLPPAHASQPTGGHAGEVILINDRLPTVAQPGWGNDQPTFVWDWRQPSDLQTVWVGNTTSRDLFCSGHTFLPDGAFFVTGGLNRDAAWNPTAPGPPVGHGGTFVLRTVAGNLVWEAQSEGDKRWYPVALWEPDGVRVAGHFGAPAGIGAQWNRWLQSLAGSGWLGDWEGIRPHYREQANDGSAVVIHCPDSSTPFLMDLGDYPRLLALSTGDLMWVDSRHAAPGELWHKSWFLNINPLHPKDCPADPEGNFWHWREGTYTVDTEGAKHAGGNAVLLLTRHPEADFNRWTETVYVMGGTGRGEDDKPCPCDIAGVTNVVRRIQRLTTASNDPLEPSYQPWFQQAWETSSTDPQDSGAGPKAMRRPRVNGNTVILPNGELVAIGGTRLDDDPETQAPGCPESSQPEEPNWQSIANPDATGCTHNRAAELYRPNEVFGSPSSEQLPWRLLPMQQHNRQYHSVGFLLPDGSVGSAGGTYFKVIDGILADHRYSIEIYKPWYFFAGMRPVIEVPPLAASLERNEVISFEVRTREGFSIDRLTLVRNASVTHAFDSNQRYIELHLDEPPELKAGTASTWILKFRVPENAYAVPSGWYMLSAVDNIHRPSESVWVQIQ